MTQFAPSAQRRFSTPAAKPAWVTFCLGFLPLAITRHDLEVPQSPKESDAPAGEIMADAKNRRRMKCVHKVWTGGDGFTLSGARRA